MNENTTPESENTAASGSTCSAWLGGALQGHAEWLQDTGMRADTTTLALLRGAADEIGRLRGALEEIAALSRGDYTAPNVARRTLVVAP